MTFIKIDIFINWLRSNVLVFFTSCFAALVLVGAINHFPLVFAGLSWFYMLVAGVLSVVRMAAGNKVPMLEDFDPDDE